MASPKETSGVEELIGRLRQQGVEEGKAQADALMAETRLRAEERLADARREADVLLQKAHDDVDRGRRAYQFRGVAGVAVARSVVA